MKTCSKCGETKPFAEFHKHKRNKDGYANCCKSCVAVRGRRWREDNKEAIAERKRQYYQENKEAILEYHRRYREENREAVLERKRQWYQENKEAAVECKRQYYQENKDVILERNKRWREDNKEAIAERSRQYYQENKERWAQYHQENKEACNEYSRRYQEERKAEQPGCVYQIVNSINGKVYVGETTRGELRWRRHLLDLRGNRHDNPSLQADFNEFGEDVFGWSIIQELPKDKEVLVQEEKNTIQRLLAEGKELYNIVLN